ncbi:SDR family oxidoreductase [Microlunatus elymi]|uniref:SDR family oxidoreductase n=1 Tax=Microlunatus elymi TaxID=2596828 RepID=A0A516PUQ9_9ACTN|nr:SDR family oxidoreductase [Microlunatus elymi]QDP94934.1 SDR family oxidoreductase [Microlunatus elymi]
MSADQRKSPTEPQRGNRPPAHGRRRILITGASSGLGAQLARIWADDGRDLALCARRLPELERLRDELLDRHPHSVVHVYQLDVSDAEATERVVERAVVDLGGLDRVVAGAGIGMGARVGSGHADVNRRVLTTNVIGTWNTAEAAIRHFWDRQDGHLVIISSMAALRGFGGAMAAYSTSKAAIATLGESLRSSLARRPITVSTIFPGNIDTAINAGNPDKKWSVPLEVGTAQLAAAIEAEPASAYVPRRPWAYVAPIMRVAPLSVVRRLVG